MIENLEELFAGPGRRGFCPEIIEHQEGGIANRLKARIVSLLSTRHKAGPQMIEQIWNDHEESSVSSFDLLVDDGGSKMGFPATEASLKEHPAFGLGRETTRIIVSLLQLHEGFGAIAGRIGIEGVKAHMRQRGHVRSLAQAGHAALRKIILDAGAR